VPDVPSHLPFGEGNEEIVARLREKREFVRVASPVAVAYRVEQPDGSIGPSRAAMVMCLSMSGARLLTTEELPAGAQLRLDLPIPSMLDPSTLVAEVLRCFEADEPGRWMVPLQFMSVDRESVRSIGHYVEERFETESTQREGLARRLNLLEDLTQVLHATMDPDRILAAVIDVACELVRAESGGILLLNTGGDRLDFAVARGPKADEVAAFSLAMGEGIAGWVAESGHPLAVDHPSEDRRWKHEISEAIGHPTNNLAAVPLRLREQTIGVLEVVNKLGSGSFTSADLRVLETLGAQASIVIENVRLFHDLESSAAQAQARVKQAADKLNIWRRAAEGNMTQAAVCVPLATGEFLANEAAQVLLTNLGPLRPIAETRLRSLLEDIRLVAPAAVRTSGSYLIHEADPESPILMAYVSMLLDDHGEPGALVAHLLDMRSH
jgi:hypothetical protein